MVNIAFIQGRLTKDPEMRYTQNQTPVCSFTVACDRDYTEKGQEKQTDFIDCVAWKNTGVFVEKYFSKGSMILITGRLQGRKWTDKDGNKRTSWEIIVDRANFCGEKKKDGGKPEPAAVDVGYSDLEDSGGDLPF